MLFRSVKIDIPGKGATVAFVDSIETPTVRLQNGDVVKVGTIQDPDFYARIFNQIDDVLFEIDKFKNIKFLNTAATKKFGKKHIFQKELLIKNFKLEIKFIKTTLTK